MTPKRYWLRGGLLGLFFPVVAILIATIISGLLKPFYNTHLSSYEIFSFFYSFPLLALYEITGIDLFSGGEVLIPSIMGFGIVALCYFLVGIIIGWIYREIKRRKNLSL